MLMYECILNPTSLVSELYFSSTVLLLLAVDDNSFQGLMTSTAEPTLERKKSRNNQYEKGVLKRSVADGEWTSPKNRRRQLRDFLLGL